MLCRCLSCSHDIPTALHVLFLLNSAFIESCCWVRLADFEIGCVHVSNEIAKCLHYRMDCRSVVIWASWYGYIVKTAQCFPSKL